ncbi:MAG: hypothetical protein WCQ86_02780 [Bacteroidaceae bacterium]
MKEEDDILKKCGKGNPFTVPEGYFEQFTSNLMNHLPEKQEKVFIQTPKVSMTVRLKPLMYLAASFVGLILMIKALIFVSAPTAHSSKTKLSTSPIASTAITTVDTASEIGYSDQELEAIVDRSKLDDYGVYQLVSEQTNN